MNTYIALLRGINVSGQKKIIMEDLRRILSKGDLKNIQTYIQSGNVIFNSSNNDCKELSRIISTYIYKDYGFQVPVIVKTLEEWSSAIDNNPFLKNDTIDIKQLYITFLSEIPSDENIELMNQVNFHPDAFIIQDDLVYSLYPNGAGRSKMTINKFEKKLKVSATSRNWNTTKKLFALASNN